MAEEEGTPKKALGVRVHEARTPARISGAFSAAKSTWVEIPDPDGPPAAWVYSDERSYADGETVCLCISATVAKVDVRIYRDGANPVTVMQWKALNVAFQSIPPRVFEVGCSWSETVAFPLSDAFLPGAYIVEITRAGVSAAEQIPLAHHIFFVRARQADPSAIVLIATTSTWTAYNDWGGSSHYRGVNDEYPQGASPRLAIRRPWARGQVFIPPGVPRFTAVDRPTRPEPAKYPSLDWASANGYTRYYAAAGWPSYELPFLKWAESAGYTVHVIAQDDLHRHPDCLDGYQCAVIVGHDEYWSRPMRETVHRFVEGGGHVARFAGNYMWQIRFEDDQTQVCYKFTARDLDPIGAGQKELMTGAWEDVQVGLPGARTFGVNAMRGQYAGFGGMAPRAGRGFQVFRPDHWAFEGTGLGYSDTFGDEAGIFGFEVDGLEYTFRDGLPEPTGKDGAPEGLEIIAMNWATQIEKGLPEHAYSYFMADGDARFAAATLDGADTKDAVARRGRGCGVMVSFEMGAGTVVCAGSCEWVRGLALEDFYTVRVTQNILDRFLGSSEIKAEG
ncbi:N,N-dimethylformamidase beta subunit family domain-containing protein [Mesorhizobium sp. CO1-1-8]|uniref:N,N-dimethylformamidase beta subunit family domain-containing protein n=1 Tax=Mesorhizobium sp. CO1-1-8 TaxID=2876631 RepID=UPI001CD1196F|nr:N,N-dimethylformamidase beta subunit family domain-containing protein [Mesorhizobium sp. CO1-1-8]MBZ9772193.1 hypothetical protein [Mesorhizobium sp. CO1-1-8]